MSRSTPQNCYPMILVEDRYGGSYSGGAWLAIANALERENELERSTWSLNFGPYGGDAEAAAFWTNAPDWIAVGATPDEAIHALIKKRG